MLKWIAVPVAALLAVLPTASKAQLCSISPMTVTALQNELAVVIALPDANGGFSNRTGCGRRSSIGREGSAR